MIHTSLWKAISKKEEEFITLKSNLEVDVAVIGGGITGITAAQELIREGKDVAVIEADEIGGVTTSLSTGNLYIAVQPYYQKIENNFDFETAKNIAYSRKLAINYIEDTVNKLNIHCQFSRRPWYIYTQDQKKLSMLEKEIELLKKMELPIEYTTSLPFSLSCLKAAIMKDQARINPLQYVLDVAAALQKKGCKIFKKTRIVDIKEKKFCLLTTEDGHTIKAKKVIMASHTPIGFNSTQFFTAPYRSYAVAAKLSNNIYPECHLWDLDDPHHATCTHAISQNNQPEILITAGSHHKVGQHMSGHYEQLENYLKENFDVSEITYQWSAQHYQSADNVPYIGQANRFTKNIYMATGFFADGLVYGTLAGIIISQIILEKSYPLEKLYQSKRLKPYASFAFLLKENFNVLAQYYKDIPKFGKPSFDDIKTGEGKVKVINREKCAVYRDENEELHIVSAACTHLKCIVNWNSAEKSWDCPCHGSRFDTEGKVLEGPAKSNLRKKNEYL